MARMRTQPRRSVIYELLIPGDDCAPDNHFTLTCKNGEVIVSATLNKKRMSAGLLRMMHDRLGIAIEEILEKMDFADEHDDEEGDSEE